MQGNAAYIYYLQKLPFELDGVRDINLSTLTDRSASIERLIHRDNVDNYNRWEQRFNDHLSHKFGIRVSNTGKVPEQSRTASYYTSGNTTSIMAFCQAFKLGTEDTRLSGGYFWILADDQTPIINQQLRAWGFAYRAGRGWFRNS